MIIQGADGKTITSANPLPMGLRDSAGNPVENTDGTLLASAARTATTPTSNQTNYSASGVYITINVTNNPGGAETLTLLVQALDPVTGNPVTLGNSGVVITGANGIRTFLLYPGAVETIANSELFVQGIPVPRTWRANVAHSGTGSWTYSLGCQYVV